MSRMIEGVRTRSVPMLPDSSIVWEATEVPSERLKVYSSPSADESAVRMAMELARRPPSSDEVLFVGGGQYSTAWKYGNTVLKMFKDGVEYADIDGNKCGLNGLRANIALSRGLEKVGPLVTAPKTGPEVSYNYRTPDYYACVMPLRTWSSAPEQQPARPVWLMSYEDGHHFGSLAPPQQRHLYFNGAARAAGLPSRLFDWDDHEENTIVRQLSDDPADVEYVKFDVMANDRFPY